MINTEYFQRKIHTVVQVEYITYYIQYTVQKAL